MQCRLLLLAALVAGFTTILMPAFFDLGTDMVLHYTLIECFATQFWQGDIYPRWCNEANGGLGSPYFITYYPFAYYITAFLWPLHWLGLSVGGIYIAALWLCSSVTFCTAWLWLKGIAGPKKALFAALIYLWIPYRMEVMLSRASYPELWMLAWLPLIMLLVQQLVQQKKGAAFLLAITTGLSLLTQVPTTICALMICSLYILLMAYKKPATLLRYTAAMFGAASLAAIYLAPGAYYKRFLSDHMQVALDQVWVCRHIMLSDFADKPWLMIGLVVTFIVFISLAIKTYRNRHALPDILSKEASVLAICALVAVFALTPLSVPLWDIWRSFGLPGMPWRMQGVLAIIAIYFVALHMGHLLSEKKLKTWKGDYAMLLMFMTMIALPLNSVYSDEQKEVVRRGMEAKLIHFEEHFPRWVASKYTKPDHIVGLYENLNKPAFVAINDGTGIVENVQWKNSAIHIDVTTFENATLRLQHYYYPMWKVLDANGNAIPIGPETETGLMRLVLPTGEQSITIHRDIYGEKPFLQWAKWLSLFAWAGVLLLLARHCLGFKQTQPKRT